MGRGQEASYPHFSTRLPPRNFRKAVWVDREKGSGVVAAPVPPGAPVPLGAPVPPRAPAVLLLCLGLRNEPVVVDLPFPLYFPSVSWAVIGPVPPGASDPLVGLVAAGTRSLCLCPSPKGEGLVYLASKIPMILYT